MKKRMLHVFDKVSVLALFLAVVIAVTCLLLPGEVTAAWDGTVAANFQSGAGTQGNPYIISTPAQLAKFLTGLNSTVTYEGQSLQINTRNGLHYVDVENISAPDLNALYSVTVDDGVQTATVTCSPLSYCNSVYKNASGVHSQELHNVAAALILYNRAADNYFFPNS